MTMKRRLNRIEQVRRSKGGICTECGNGPEDANVQRHSFLQWQPPAEPKPIPRNPNGSPKMQCTTCGRVLLVQFAFDARNTRMTGDSTVDDEGDPT